MAYSDIVLDHFQQPRNVGDLEAPDAVAEEANPICGDRIRLSLRIRDGIIEEARWQGEGCVPALAAASLATELLRGRSLEFQPLLDEPTLECRAGRRASTQSPRCQHGRCRR